jgi:DNA modification methylase
MLGSLKGKVKEDLIMKTMSELIDKIVIGDCVEKLKEIPDHSIDLIILDPPYWKVIGEEWDYKWRTIDDYVAWCRQWLPELGRVIKYSGSMYLFGFIRNLFYLQKDIEELGFIFRQQLIVNKGIKVVGGRATKGYKMFPNVTESILFYILDAKPLIKKLLLERQKVLGLTAFEINERLGVKANGGGGMVSLYRE